MDVLNAAGLTPISLPKSPDRRRCFPFKFPRSTATEFLAKRFGSGLALLNLASSAASAKSLTYEEALEQSVRNSSSFGNPSDFDIGQLLDGVINFATENSLVVAGGAAVLALPLVLSLVLKGSKPWGVESAKRAYAKLSEDREAQLLDIREGKEFQEVGRPDIRNLKKRAVSIAYRGDDKQGFLKKLSLRFKDPANTTLFVLDKFDGNSALVAELATVNGFKSAFAIKDGAEGPRGWLKTGLPWSPPKKSIDIDFSDLQDAISSAIGGDSEGLPVTLGLAAATGLGLLAFSEIETVLQLLGSAALIQFITKKLLFAKDREVTLKQIDEFLKTKVAPKELTEEIKTIGKALLPVSGTSSSQPEKAADVPETNLEASSKPSLTVNSVPKAEIEEESRPSRPRPLSPYPYYPDFKPPSSPCPSQP